MDISNFFTVQAPREEQKISGGNTSGSSVMPADVSFLDFILARLAEENPETPKPEEHKLLSSDNPVLDSDIDIAELIADNPEIREQIEAWSLDPNMKLSEALALNQKALDDALAPVTDGIITTANVEAGSPRLMQALLIDAQAEAKTNNTVMAKLKAILAKLDKLAAEPETGGLALTNLTPEQITDLKAKIEALLNQDVDAALTEEQKRKALDGIYLGLIKLLAPDEQSRAATLQAAVAKKQEEQNTQLNNLARPAPKKGEAPAVGQSPWSDAAPEEGYTRAAPQNQFANTLKDFSNKKGGTEMPATPGVKPDLSALQGWPFTLSGSIFSPTMLPYDEYGAPVPLPAVTSLGTLTNLVTQAHTASQPHPAVQVVAATISKAAANGETKNITLQLEPPELGRVEVRMAFSKDKTVKAIVVAEKPETHLLLQRDGHLLERALFDSGLDASGSSLSFELAHEGYDFNGRGGDGHGGYARNEGAPEEIIESTMTWRVDPETGHMRYSILA
jgi:flagellar hook-length control protein FliK